MDHFYYYFQRQSLAVLGVHILLLDHLPYYNYSADLFNYQNIVDSDGHVAFGGLKGRSQPKQDPPIEKELSLTLEEAFNGCIKKMKIARKVHQRFGIQHL